VGVNHGGADVAVAQEFLDCADVIAVLQHVRREGMPKGVAAGVFVDTGLPPYNPFVKRCPGQART